MNNKIALMFLIGCICFLFKGPLADESGEYMNENITHVEKTEKEWKSILSEEEYYILREKGTESAFSGNFWNSKKKGLYICAGCKLPLFSSETKFDSGTGWPSYYKAVNDKNVKEEVDKSLFMVRTEVLCARCKGHLGHVFEDGPKPTGRRYCINSAALKFKSEE